MNEIEKELKNRIEQLESKNYVFPKRFDKNDYIFTFIVVIVCIAFVVGGAFL